MNFESVPGSEEKQPGQIDPKFESKQHALSTDEILAHLKKDFAFQELWHDEAALQEKADVIQQVLDQMVQEEENKEKDPHRLYYQASMTEGVAPKQKEEDPFDPDLNR